METAGDKADPLGVGVLKAAQGPESGLLHDRQTDAVFRTLFSAYPDALVVADAGGRIELVNAAAGELLGYAVDELVGMNVDLLVPDAVRSRHASYRHAFSREARPRPMGTQTELVAKRKDGSDVMVEIALSPLPNDGQPLVVAAIRDIGAYPRMKQALQRARYSETLAQIGRLAVNSREPETLLEHVTEAAARVLELDVALVYLLEVNRLQLRLAGIAGAVSGERIGYLVNNHPP